MGHHTKKRKQGTDARPHIAAASIVVPQFEKPADLSGAKHTRPEQPADVGVPNPVRRNFLGGLLAVMTAGPVTAAANAIGITAGGLFLLEESSKPWAEHEQNRLFGLERPERLKKILLPSDGKLDVVPAFHSTTATFAGSSYANEDYATQAIRDLFPASPLGVRQRGEELYPVDPGNSMICLGSSVSNLATRQVLGPPERPSFSHKHEGADFGIEFPYSVFKTQEGVTRLQDGNPEYYVPLKVIVDKGGIVATPRVEASLSGRKLAGDILLVTRVPLHLGGSTCKLLFAGTHGPGVRAVRNLFTDISRADLEYLENFAKDEPYYQAIFVIEDLYERDGTTFPGPIRLLKGNRNRPQPVTVKP